MYGHGGVLFVKHNTAVLLCIKTCSKAVWGYATQWILGGLTVKKLCIIVSLMTNQGYSNASSLAEWDFLFRQPQNTVCNLDKDFAYYVIITASLRDSESKEPTPFFSVKPLIYFVSVLQR